MKLVSTQSLVASLLFSLGKIESKLQCRSILNGGTPFRLISSPKTSGNFCLAIAGKQIIVEPCDESSKLQSWLYDPKTGLRNQKKPQMCVKYHARKPLKLVQCSKEGAAIPKAFWFDFSLDGSIKWTGDRRRVLTILQLETGSKVQMKLSEKVSSPLQQWRPEISTEDPCEPILGDGNIFRFVRKTEGSDDLCLTKSRKNLVLKPCNASMKAQNWIYGTDIGLRSHNKLHMCVWKLKKKVKLIPCKKDDDSEEDKFKFDISLDGSIQWMKDRRHILSVSKENVNAVMELTTGSVGPNQQWEITTTKPSQYRIPVTPKGALGGQILFCNIETNMIESNNAGIELSLKLQTEGYKCYIFLSANDPYYCLGVELKPADPSRDVTMVSTSTINMHNIVWASNGDGTLRPLHDISKCLTDKGFWWTNNSRSFALDTPSSNRNQIWTYDEATKAIANVNKSPVKADTSVLDRNDGDERLGLITWDYTGGYKQGWLTAHDAFQTLKTNPETFFYPVDLIINADGSLDEPEALMQDRLKGQLNILFGTFGNTLYSRDYSTFPGNVPVGKILTSKRISFNMLFDPKGRVVKNWKSTGLYALPNEKVSIQIHNTDAVSFKVRINTHTDKLKTDSENILKRDKKYERIPIVTSVVSINGANMEVNIWSDIGGLIVLESETSSKNDLLDVTVKAIAAPHYTSSMSEESWRTLCTNPVPLGEIEGKYFVATEFSSKLCALNASQLDKIIAYYDDIVISCEELAGFDKIMESGKHRFVYDVQITEGGAHAGFPIMTLWDLVKSPTDQIDLWGNAHELGHNYQYDCFRSRFGIEVTVNLFSVHYLEKSFPDKITLYSRYTTVIDKLDQGILNYDTEDDLFVKLIFLVQIKHLVGWEPYKKIYQTYRNISDKEESEKCSSDQTKLDFFYTKISEVAEVDFTEHFESWKLPISQEAKQAVSARNYSQPTHNVSRLVRDLGACSKIGKVLLQNVMTNRYLFSADRKSEDGVEGNVIVGTDDNYNFRGYWMLRGRNCDATVITLQNTVSGQYLFSIGDMVLEGEFHESRSLWYLEKKETYNLLMNDNTKKYLFSTGDPTSDSEGGWLSSPVVVGSDMHDDNRAAWIFISP